MINIDTLTQQQLDQCAEAASLLWQRGWAERNGGNLMLRLESSTSIAHNLEDAPLIDSGVSSPHLAGMLFYVKGKSCRMRTLAQEPLSGGCIIEICPDGRHYHILSKSSIVPTSELSAHLMLHEDMVCNGKGYRASLHTHPTNLIALSHLTEQEQLQSSLTDILHSMLPEARLFCPKGISWVPVLEPGSLQLAECTVQALKQHDICLWAKHGVCAIGPDLIEAFDTVDIMEKAADIYLRLRSAIPRGQ
ncbi:MAG: rhamnulose-1-phosphate aldolase [Bacteroidales bacterium]|nr:rhamnulose-1-phosphate aldolase [Bacteroidales bacterium]